MTYAPFSVMHFDHMNHMGTIYKKSGLNCGLIICHDVLEEILSLIMQVRLFSNEGIVHSNSTVNKIAEQKIPR